MAPIFDMTAITSVFAGLQARRPLVQPALMTSLKNYVKIPGRPGFRTLPGGGRPRGFGAGNGGLYRICPLIFVCQSLTIAYFDGHFQAVSSKG